MIKPVLASFIVILAAACGPKVSDDQDDQPGVLEYEDPASEFYRLERRVEVITLDPVLGRDGCGFLTDRAYDDLVTTIDALDPTADYVWSDCLPGANPKGLVHLEGFEHSPFVCDWNCCHADLLRVALVYFVVGNNLVHQEPVIDGVPYVALDPDRPCP
jgi:hypothetical protein